MNLFKAEDFDGWEAIENPTDEPSVGEWCAERANTLLAQRLAECKTVYGSMPEDYHYWHSEPGDSDHTHKAKIVCIEKLDVVALTLPASNEKIIRSFDYYVIEEPKK